jgi:hypothetical protein
MGYRARRFARSRCFKSCVILTSSGASRHSENRTREACGRKRARPAIPWSRRSKAQFPFGSADSKVARCGTHEESYVVYSRMDRDGHEDLHQEEPSQRAPRRSYCGAYHRHSKVLRFFMLCSAWRQPQSGGARLCSGVPQKLFYQLTAAVAHCHGQNVIHRECA